MTRIVSTGRDHTAPRTLSAWQSDRAYRYERTPDERGWGLWLSVGAGIVIWACIFGAVL